MNRRTMASITLAGVLVLLMSQPALAVFARSSYSPAYGKLDSTTKGYFANEMESGDASYRDGFYVAAGDQYARAVKMCPEDYYANTAAGVAYLKEVSQRNPTVKDVQGSEYLSENLNKSFNYLSDAEKLLNASGQEGYEFYGQMSIIRTNQAEVYQLEGYPNAANKAREEARVYDLAATKEAEREGSSHSLDEKIAYAIMPEPISPVIPLLGIGAAAIVMSFRFGKK